MNQRTIRKHPASHMTGVGELKGITEPAVVLRPDGSIDTYGDVAVVDQNSHDQPYTWIAGHDRELHEHRRQGQVLRHAHPDGDKPHAYFGHPEDYPLSVSPDELYDGTPLAAGEGEPSGSCE